MHTINDVIDADTAQIIAEELGHKVKRVAEADVVEGLMGETDSDETSPCRARRSSPSWAMSITARHRCSMPSARPMWWPARPAASPSISAPIRSRRRTASSPSSTRRAMRPSPPCGRAAPRPPISSCWWSPPMTASCRRRSKPSTTPRAAEVPIIVAINKIDKQQANPTRVRTDLLQHEIVVESMGGDTLEVEVSALKGTNLDKLLEIILLQAEVLDLKANPDREASGIVVEAQLDKGRGPVATVLVQRGTLQSRRYLRRRARPGAGCARSSTTRASRSKRPARRCRSRCWVSIRRPRPATSSWSSRTRRGRARSPIIANASGARPRGAAVARASLEQMMSQLKEGGRKEVPGARQGRRPGFGGSDRAGAGEARQRRGAGARHPLWRRRHQRIATWRSPRPRARCCSASMSAPTGRRAMPPSAQGIEIRYYNIIYDLVDDVKQAMSGLLAADLARDLPRQRRNPRDLQHHQGRQGRRLPGHRRRRSSAAPRCGSSATTSSCTKARCRRSSASRTKCARCRSARNAAWPSRAIRTCAPATSSSASASKRCSAR